MTWCGARVGEGSSHCRDEIPIVAGRVECQHEDTKGVAIARLTISGCLHNGMVIFAAGPNNEFTDTIDGVGHTIWILRCEPVVNMIVAS